MLFGMGRRGKDKRCKAAKQTEKGAKKKADHVQGAAELSGKKADQERKELGKGSEEGQTKRAEKSRKWWKFGSKE